MTRHAAWLLLAILLGPALAQTVPSGTADSASAPTALNPLHHGYAFDQPEILIRQRLFGLAHGLSLLAAACLDVPEQSGATQEAYAAWHEKQAQTIDAMVRDLARHYFGVRSEEATWADLVSALNLKNRIQDALGAVALEAACASLPTAIARPRYQLDRLLVENNAADAASGADVDVLPATDGPSAEAAEPPRKARGMR